MFAKSQSDNLSRTNAALMETPLFSDLYQKNRELEEQVHMLKCNISYFESTNRKLLRKVDKLKVELKSCKKEKKEKKNGLRKEGPAIKMTIEEEELVPRQLEKEFDETFEGSDSCEATLETFEATSKDNVIVIEDDEEEETSAEEEEVVEEEETSAGSDSCEATKEEGEGEEEEVVVEEEEEEEELVVEGEEEGEEGEEEGEEEEEVEGEEEVVVEGEEEEEATEEEVVVVEEEEEETSAGSDSCEATKEEEVVVEGEEEEEEATEEEEDVYEIEINGKTYYVSNEQNSVIYAADESGDITIEAGVYKNGKPVFN